MVEILARPNGRARWCGRALALSCPLNPSSSAKIGSKNASSTRRPWFSMAYADQNETTPPRTRGEAGTVKAVFEDAVSEPWMSSSPSTLTSDRPEALGKSTGSGDHRSGSRVNYSQNSVQCFRGFGGARAIGHASCRIRNVGGGAGPSCVRNLRIHRHPRVDSGPRPRQNRDVPVIGRRFRS
jgi:hypothetical protein